MSTIFNIKRMGPFRPIPIFWGILLLLVATVHATPYGPAVITVAKKVAISGDKIFLGDIARIETGDVKTRRALERLMIGRSPTPGRSRQISANLIRSRIKQYRLNHPQSTYVLPKQISVHREGVRIDGEKLRPWLADFVAAHKPPQVNSFHIKKVRLPQAVILPKGRITHKVAFARNVGDMGVMPLTVSFFVDGRFQTKSMVLVEMEAWANVVVLRNYVRRNRLIRMEDVDLVSMEVSQMPEDVIYDPQDVIGKRIKKSSVADTVLREVLVRTPTLINRGDVVTIVVETNGFRITTLGQAKRRGHRGERIRVVNLDSKRTVYARVIDSRTVKVEF